MCIGYAACSNGNSNSGVFHCTETSAGNIKNSVYYDSRFETGNILRHFLGITKLDKEKIHCIRGENSSIEHSKRN
jgi:hypothetical protein